MVRRNPKGRQSLSSVKQAAIDYAYNHFRVIPIHGIRADGSCTCQRGKECHSAGKHPSILAWQKDASSDVDIVTNWMDRRPVANVGIAMGGEERLIAIDIDGAIGMECLLDLQREHEQLPKTMTAVTGSGGRHYIFRCPDEWDMGRIKNLSKIRPGVDVRAEGGQIVVWPSRHKSGHMYEWAQPIHPPVPMPRWLYDVVCAGTPAPTLTAVPDIKPELPKLDGGHKPRKHESIYVASAIIKTTDAILAAREGTRNSTLNREAYSLLGLAAGGYLTQAEAEHHLASAARSIGLGEAEIAATLRSAWEAAQRSPRTITDRPRPERGASARPGEDPSAIGEVPSGVPMRVSPVNPGDDEYGPHEDCAPLPKMARTPLERGDHVEMTDIFTSSIGDCVYDQNSSYRYSATSGVWQIVHEYDEIKSIMGFAGSPVGEKQKEMKMNAGDVSGVVKLSHSVMARRGFFNDRPTGLMFQDGFLEVRGSEVELRDHSPRWRARSGYDFRMIGESYPSMFISSLREVFDGDEDRDQKIELLREFVGISLLGMATKYAKCMFFTGVGSNGKSMVVDVINSVIPKESLTHVKPQAMKDNTFKVRLLHSLFNSVAEIGASTIKDSDEFKAIITGDNIMARDVYEKSVTFRPRAGHLFSANDLPNIDDFKVGMWRRIMVLDFAMDFSGASADKRRAEKIVSAERAQIARWAIAGARALIARNDYDIPPSSAEHVSKWKRKSNPAAEFAHECLRKSTCDTTGGREMYARFRQWCVENGEQPLTNRKFGVAMRDSGMGSRHSFSGSIYDAKIIK